MSIAHQPTEIDIAHDVLNGFERNQLVRRIVHREHNAGDDLKYEEETGQNAEVPHVVQVARHRITGTHGIINETRQRKPLIQPFHDTVLWFVLACPGKAHRNSLKI